MSNHLDRRVKGTGLTLREWEALKVVLDRQARIESWPPPPNAEEIKQLWKQRYE